MLMRKKWLMVVYCFLLSFMVVTVGIKSVAAKEKKAEDLLLMLVDPETGKVVFITIDEIDPVTGELKVTLPFLGAITLLDKSAVDENEIETQTTDAGAADTETAAE